MSIRLLRAFEYHASFALLATIPLGLWLSTAISPAWLGAALPLAIIYVLVPLLDASTPRFDDDRIFASSPRLRGYLRWLPFAAGIVHLAIYAGAFVYLLGNAPFSLPLTLFWAVVLGDIAGVTAINIGHELIHRDQRVFRVLGGALLASVGYGIFKIEHVRGHHVDVATGRDPSSARQGESVYRKIPGAVLGNFAKAWRLEHKRLGGRVWSWENEYLQLNAVVLAIAGLFAFAYGWIGVLVFLLHCAVAIFTLEVINYIEHYGLRRNKLASGRYERPTAAHAWNADDRVSSALLFELPRHSDHHTHARRGYFDLESRPEAPQLPAGYAAMFWLALIPPLWFAVMDKRVPASQMES